MTSTDVPDSGGKIPASQFDEEAEDELEDDIDDEETKHVDGSRRTLTDGDDGDIWNSSTSASAVDRVDGGTTS